MNFSSLKSVLLLSILLISCGPDKVKRVLLFADKGNNPGLSQEGLQAVKTHLDKNDISADTTTNPLFLQEDSLKHYGSVVFLNLGQDVFTVRQQNEIERFVQAGGSLVTVHSFPATKYQWSWFNDLSGFSAMGTVPSEIQKQQLVVANDGNTSTRSLPAKFAITDQLIPVKDLHENAKILLKSDRDQPVSWINETSSGRIFTTTAGGTSESYKDENLLKHILGGIQYSLEGDALDYTRSSTPRVPEENRFIEVMLDTYLDEPIEMEILKDGKVLFIERHGRLKLYDPSKKETKIIGTLNVQLEGNYEDGLLGLELDPAFESNHYIYLYYSPLGGEPIQRLSRFKIEGDTLVKSSEKVVMTVPVQRETCCHSAGNVYFAPDGNLYLSTGDNTSSKESDGFTPIDERPGRGPFDAQKSSANTHDLRGKILRIHVEEDGTYTIPDGNLFPKDGSKGKPEIYVMGARNPYRITVDKRGFLYWGDVGPDGGQDTERGPRSHDEFNQARTPGYYGWPYFVADNKAYADFDFETNKVGADFDPENVINESPNNFGSKKLPAAQPAMIYYPYNKSNEFPMLGTGSRSAMAGPFYYYDDYQSDVKLPRYYDGKLLIFEWGRNWIKAVSFTNEGDLKQIESFLPSFSFWHPIDVKFGKDGALYVLQYGSNYFARNPDAQLVRIEYAEGNRQPIAKITGNKIVGAIPLTVSLSAKSSFDYDANSKLTYTWNSGDGETSTESEPTFTYEKPGVYKVSLAVTDEQGGTSKTEMDIKAGNEIPVVKVDVKENRSFYFDNGAVTYHVSAEDKEDGSLGKGIDPEQVKFSIDYIKEGKDLALMNSLGASVNAKHLKGKSLMDGSDCRSCHSMDKRSVGPSWIEVADRYKGKSNSIPMLVEKIIKGGNGNWGHAMMAAHPQLTQQDTKQMVEYILSIADENASLPLQGVYKLKEHNNNGEAGSYIITASYTDKGHEITGPLTGRETMILRHTKVQAEDFDYFKNVGQERPVGSGLAFVSDIKNGSYIAFKNIDLKDIATLLFNVQANNGSIDIKIGSADGEIIGTADLKGDAKGWRTIPAKIKSIDGMSDLYFVFKNDEMKNKKFAGLDWIEFKK